MDDYLRRVALWLQYRLFERGICSDEAEETADVSAEIFHSFMESIEAPPAVVTRCIELGWIAPYEVCDCGADVHGECVESSDLFYRLKPAAWIAGIAVVPPASAAEDSEDDWRFRLPKVEMAVRSAGKNAPRKLVKYHVDGGMNEKQFLRCLRHLENEGKYSGFCRRKRAAP